MILPADKWINFEYISWQRKINSRVINNNKRSFRVLTGLMDRVKGDCRDI